MRGDQRADLPAKDVFQRGPSREDRGHLHPELGQRGRHLAPDEPHAHDDRAPARHRLALDRVAVGHRAQIVDPGQLGPGNPEPAVPASGGDQELAVARVPRPSPGPPCARRGPRPRRSIRCAGPHRVARTSRPAGRTSLRDPPPTAGTSWTAEDGRRGRPVPELMITTGPAKPSSRRVAAALPPARPPPTITIGSPLIRSGMDSILPSVSARPQPFTRLQSLSPGKSPGAQVSYHLDTPALDRNDPGGGPQVVQPAQ